MPQALTLSHRLCWEFSFFPFFSLVSAIVFPLCLTPQCFLPLWLLNLAHLCLWNLISNQAFPHTSLPLCFLSTVSELLRSCPAFPCAAPCVHLFYVTEILLIHKPILKSLQTIFDRVQQPDLKKTKRILKKMGHFTQRQTHINNDHCSFYTRRGINADFNIWKSHLNVLFPSLLLDQICHPRVTPCMSFLLCVVFPC